MAPKYLKKSYDEYLLVPSGTNVVLSDRYKYNKITSLQYSSSPNWCYQSRHCNAHLNTTCCQPVPRLLECLELTTLKEEGFKHMKVERREKECNCYWTKGGKTQNLGGNWWMVLEQNLTVRNMTFNYEESWAHASITIPERGKSSTSDAYSRHKKLLRWTTEK